MKYKIVSPENLSEGELASWRELVSANARYASPYFQPDYCQIIGQTRDDVSVIVAEDDTAGIVGIIPFQASGVGLRLARPIGAPFTDYNGPILKQGFEQLAGDMLSYAKVSVYSFSGFPICGDDINFDAEIEPEIDISKVDPALLKYGVSIRNKTRAFVADLSIGYEDYLESRRSEYPKHFKKSRRLWRQAEKEAGKLEIQFHEDSEEALDTLIGWKKEQFSRTGLHDVLGPQWSKDMLKKCFATQNQNFAGVLTTLRCDGNLMAAEFGVRSGDLLHGWVSGYNIDYHSYSPGMLLQTRLLEEACKAGVMTADLGIGAEHYKKYYASYQRPVSQGVLPASGVTGAVRSLGGEIWNQIEVAPLGPVSKFAGKLRRRLDVILSVEQTMAGRKQGLIQAFKK